MKKTSIKKEGSEPQRQNRAPEVLCWCVVHRKSSRRRQASVTRFSRIQEMLTSLTPEGECVD
uniref:Uncharacterized protein n=1 Tax=Hyaloperonospora arabidopsidis (strain Emoy2) TaxID=559515 RepID=M4B1J3_HYAAE